jgi:hypothetical protein
MLDLIWGALIFYCGAFVGFIVGAFLAASREADREARDFDGGFTHDHPPVKTTIWSRDIETTKDKPQ